VNKLERIRKALLNIDFVSGEINSDYYWGRFKEIVYLTNKNVLVFNGIEHDAYIYLPWQKKTKLSVISHESMRTYWFDFLQEIYRSNPACILDSDARALSSRIPDQDILPLLPQLRRAAVCRKRDDEYSLLQKLNIKKKSHISEQSALLYGKWGRIRHRFYTSAQSLRINVNSPVIVVSPND